MTTTRGMLTKSVAILLFIALIGSFFPNMQVFAATGEIPGTAAPVSIGTKNTITVTDANGTVKWFKVDPSSFIYKATHIAIRVSGNTTEKISVYQDLESAQADWTYNEYKDKASSVDFPLAWKGPYYIKIKSSTAGNYTLVVNSSNLTNYPNDVKVGSVQSSSFNATTDEVIVKFKNEVNNKEAEYTAKSITKKIDRNSDVDVTSSPKGNTHVVEVTGDVSAKELAAELRERSDVQYAEPNYKVYAFANDVYYNEHWSLNNTGQYGGLVGADINYPDIERLLSGKNLTTQIIAVLDTGINYTLQDFSGILRTDIGYDFYNVDNDPWDDDFHGTHVSGTIAALANNGYSMTGINSHSTILPLKVLGADGAGTQADIADAIYYAVDKGAKVINLSLGSEQFSQTIEDSLRYAWNKGVTVVAATGNESSSTISYPARSKYTIAVGATNQNDERANFSNYGTGIDLVAPGEYIPSLTPNGEIGFASGTSMATPHVTAVVGLMYSIKPDITPAEVREILLNNTVDLGTAGYDTFYGYGRLDAAKVISAMEKTNRISGKNRFATAVAISKEEWAQADTVLVANGLNFPDALAAVPLAYKLNAPILLTGEKILDTSTKSEITRLKASKVVIIGGTGAISSEVEKELTAMGLTTERIGGGDRFETAALIAEKLDNKTDKAIVAYGMNFPDALAVAPYAAKNGIPILLTRSNNIPSSTEAILQTVGSTIVVGGEGIISNEILEQMPSPTRISGRNRYDTGVNIARTLVMGTDQAFIATGTNYPDALTGAVLAAKEDAALLLVTPNAIPTNVLDFLSEKRFGKYTVLGGTASVSSEVFAKLSNY